MRVLALPVENNLLELKINMWSGKEMVYWNGKQVSKKTHFLGSRHTFEVERLDGSGADIFYVLTSYGWMGYRYDVFRNNTCLLGSSCRSPLQPGNVAGAAKPRRPAGSEVKTVYRQTTREELSLEELEEQLV